MPSLWTKLQHIWIQFTNPVSSDDNGDKKEHLEQFEQFREEKPYALYERLTRECSPMRGDVRQLTTDDLVGDELIDEIIFMMFNLQPPQQLQYRSRTYTNSRGKLLAALEIVKDSRTPLKPIRSVFYVYVSEDFQDSPSYEELIEKLYRRLIQLAESEGPIKEFLNRRFTAGWNKAHPDVDATFQPDTPAHADALRYFFPCHISIHSKCFPPRQEAVVFLVGRTALHDLKEIEGHEDYLKAGIKRDTELRRADNQDEATVQMENQAKVLHALTVRGEGAYNGAALRFTAHNFSPYSPTTRREKELYLGTMPSNRTLSIGSAEHDEIQCAELHEQADKIRLHNIGLNEKSRCWEVDCNPAKLLPPWMLSPDEKLVTPQKPGCVRIVVERMPILTASLRHRITRPGFPPHIILEGRALPLEGGQLQELLATTDRALRRIFEPLNLKAAIHVQKNSFWLIRAANNTISSIIKTGATWSVRNDVTSGDITVDGVSYVWAWASARTLPPGYAGMLKILPQDNMKDRLKIELAVDPMSGALPLTYMSFDEKLHPDTLLGHRGVVAIQSIEEIGGRPAYALRPVNEAIHPYVAFKPPLSFNDDPSGWQVYDPNKQSLGIEIKEGDFVYRRNNKKVVVVGSENSLICGTSVFQIKTSGTPHRGTWAYNPEEDTAKSDEPAQPEFNPKDLEAVKMALITTAWSGYNNIQLISESNVAIHFVLANAKGDARFLKAYYPQTADNAARESNFYERFADRAVEMFIKPPDDVLRNDAGDRIWGLVFPRHELLSDKLPTLTLPQVIAIGCAVARLLRTLAEAELINYDIDRSMLCLDNNGRLVVVDFDNVFPLFGATRSPDHLKAYKNILESGVLPMKSSVHPPEAREYAEAEAGFDREKALAGIGVGFGTYLLAVMLLTLLEVAPAGDASTIVVNDEAYPNAAKEFALLLRRMLNTDVAERPSPQEVESSLSALASSLAAADLRAREEIIKLGFAV
jgi:hypothetical protein